MKLRSIHLNIFLVLTAAWLTSCSSNDSVCNTSPCTPDEALQTLEIVDGFQVELFAAEPLFRDPVAMEVDENGYIYVVEDPGYPDNQDKYPGRIIMLKDTDGDGLPDQSIVFADGFRSPRGIMRWKEGLLITDATEIIYLEDTNGDGQADVRRVVMSGFGYGNPQLGVNTPIYGLDNWIYVAQMQGSRPHFADQPEPEGTSIRTNIRFKPDTQEWESLSGASQFGHSFDAFGRHLLVSNANHIYQEVINVRYLQRNPDLLTAPSVANISDHGAAAEVFSITEDPRYELFTDKGIITAACGLTCYLGGNFPPDYQGASFVAEPAHNVVHVDKLVENGTSLEAQRIHEGQEFLASTDSWFRPVNLYVGPDGALYVIDYYRKVIEQPRFLSQDVLESDMLYDGANQGRIYRITPKDAEAYSWVEQLNLSEASVDELVPLLEHENGWWRRTAQRLLVDQRATKAVPLLEEVVNSSTNEPEARIHALWILDGIDALTPELIISALGDKSPRVREHTIRLAETRLDKSPALVRALLELVDDSDQGVQFQLLFTLGNLHGDEVRSLRQQMLYNNIDDEWIQLAALSAYDLSYQQLFEEALQRLVHHDTESHKAYIYRLAMLIGKKQQPDQIDFFVQKIIDNDNDTDEWWQAASLEGLAAGLQQGPNATEEISQLIQDAIADLSLHPSSTSLRTASQKVLASVREQLSPSNRNIFKKAAEIAKDHEMESELRADAIRLLNLDDPALYFDLFEELIRPQEPSIVQGEAVRALGHKRGEDLGNMLLSKWSELTPQVRVATVDALLADSDRVKLVLNAVEEGKLNRSDINWNHTRNLMLNPDEELRLKAQSLLGLLPRSEVLDQYQEATNISGNVERGQVVFERTCAMCHQIDGEGGVAYGPDLATIRSAQPEDLLVDILMPNSNITPGYEQWRVEFNGDNVLHGIISSETPRAVTFRNSAGRETTISRDNIQSMEAASSSAMPTGLEQQITVQEMADLLKFLVH